jgi:hypothetical protein
LRSTRSDVRSPEQPFSLHALLDLWVSASFFCASFSMMPSGLNQALSQQDLIDLVEYLSSLKKN